MLGIWKNFDDLEESLNLAELQMILHSKRDKEKQERLFLAGIQGIDLEKEEKSPVQQRLEEVKRKAAERQLGAQEVKKQEFAAMGFGYSAD